MKNLNDIITERLHITKKTKINRDFSDLINEIDVSKWEWSHPTLAKYDEDKTIVQEFAKQEFGNNNYMNEIFKQTYKYYLKEAYGWSEENIEKSYSQAIKMIHLIGWERFSYSHLERGWWNFVNWCIEQIKNK